MFGMVNEYEKSKMTIGAFVEKHGISKSTLKYWIQKKRKLATKGQPRFVELVSPGGLAEATATSPNVVQDQPENARIEFVLPNGLSIKVYV